MLDNVYTAYPVLGDDGCYVLEIKYPTLDEEDDFPEFLLSDESIVRVMHDPQHPWEGRWGQVKEEYKTNKPGSPNAKPLKRVEIVHGFWECDPKLIITKLRQQKDKIRRRNTQIEGLRNQLLALS